MRSLQALGFGRKRRWARHRPVRDVRAHQGAHQGKGGKVGKVVPARHAAVVVCEVCGFRRDGLCACSFKEMNPLEPTSRVLAVTPLAPSSSGVGSFAELELSAWPQLGPGEEVELRMALASQPERHLWPHSMRVLLDGVELVRVDPPDDQRRPDSPLKLRPPNKAGKLR